MDINDTVRLRSNIYDSVDNADVSFRRNFIDFFYLRNNEVEIAPAITLNANNAKIDTINTVGDNDMVLQRNGVEFLRLDGPNTVVNGPDNYLIVGPNVGLNTDWVFANVFANRSDDTDTDFRGAVSGGLASGIVYMTYEHVAENLHIFTDVEMEQTKRIYLHKETGKNSYISSTNIGNVNHTTFINEDPMGDLRFFANGGVRLYVTPTKVSVPPSYILEGNLVNTSDLTKKYDIKSIEHNFTDIVKQIEPKTFKMEEEKELGITKNHIGFIADDLVPVIPPEWENIVMTGDEGIKKLSYIMMGSITWGAVRELIEENETMNNKIEHLGATMYEMMEEIKELKGKKKAKAKSKQLSHSESSLGRSPKPKEN